MLDRYGPSGLTIVELVISMAISSIVILGIIPVVIFFFGSFSSSLVELKLDNEINSTSLILERDILRSQSFLEKSAAGDSSTLDGVSYWNSGGYRGGGDSSRSLFLRIPATTAKEQNKSREIVYNDLAGDCTASTATPVYYESIYYVKNHKLYKRTITPYPKGKRFCFNKTMIQTNTCTSGHGSKCYGKDIEVMDGVDSFYIDYYDNPTSNTPIKYSSNPQAKEVPAASIRIRINTSVKTSKGVVKQSVNLRKSIAW